MSAQQEQDAAATEVNEVPLVGRVSQAAEERMLPSGDAVWTFRVVVGGRPAASARTTVDALDCAAWATRPTVGGPWRAGDVVEVTGAMRRRFFRDRRRRACRGCEVEVSSAGSFVAQERMSTPRLGFGWNDVAFSGSSRPCAAASSTRSTSAAGMRTASSAAGDRSSASSTEWA